MPLPKIPKPNLIDRVVEYFAPRAAITRQKARSYLDWSNADRSKRSIRNLTGRNPSPDTANQFGLKPLRAHCADLDRNNPIAHGAAMTAVESVIGKGLSLKADPDALQLDITNEKANDLAKKIESLWRLFSSSLYCDVTMTENIHGLAATGFLEKFIQGDVFYIRRNKNREGRRARAPWKTCFQMIGAARCSNPQRGHDDERRRQGIEIDRDGAPLRYWFQDSHPGDMAVKRKNLWTPIPAWDKAGDRKVFHLFYREAPGQHRGIPALARIVSIVKQIGDLTESEAEAAVTSSFFVAFVKTQFGDGLLGNNPSQTNTGGGTLYDDESQFGPGMMIDLNAGEEVQIAKGERPNAAFEPFFNALLRQIGMATGIPYEVLLKYFQSSYSAARASIQEAWRHFWLEAHYIAEGFYQPAYEAWLSESVALGLLEMPGFFSSPMMRAAYCRADWTPQAAPKIDELKAVMAAEKRLALNLSTGQIEAARATGTDYDTNVAQRAAELERARGAGLPDGDPSRPETLEAMIASPAE